MREFAATIQSGGRALARKPMRVGDYWPHALRDTEEYAQKCRKCQEYAKVLNCPPEELTSITSLWPFAQWGIDLIGLLPPGKGVVKFIVVVVGYFTKWVEVEALATIMANSITQFLWKMVISQFSIPCTIISDNGRQLDSEHYRGWCQKLGIKFQYPSPGNPQSNGQVEATNKIMMVMLKTLLDDRKGVWAEELPSVLWSYRIMVRMSIGEMPFNLTYGHEAMPLVEIEIPMYRVQHFD